MIIIGKAVAFENNIITYDIEILCHLSAMLIKIMRLRRDIIADILNAILMRAEEL